MEMLLPRVGGGVAKTIGGGGFSRMEEAKVEDVIRCRRRLCCRHQLWWVDGP